MNAAPSVPQHLVPIPNEWPEWMVDTIADEDLPALTQDLLEKAISACNSGNFDDLIFGIHDWKATIEELSRPPEEIEAIARSRDEVSSEEKPRLGP